MASPFIYPKVTRDLNLVYKKSNSPCSFKPLLIILLSYQDSNLDRQNQKLQCYHYTIRQSFCSSFTPKALQR